MSRNLEKVAEFSQNLKRSAGLSRRKDNGDGENEENPGKGLQGCEGTRQKTNERRKNRDNNMKHHENPKIKAEEKVYQEKKRKGTKAKLKRWRIQKLVRALRKRSYWTNAMAWLQQLAEARQSYYIQYIHCQFGFELSSSDRRSSASRCCVMLESSRYARRSSSERRLRSDGAICRRKFTARTDIHTHTHES